MGGIGEGELGRELGRVNFDGEGVEMLGLVDGSVGDLDGGGSLIWGL